MPTLRELELAFVRGMFDATDVAAENFVCANGMTPAARLAIYRNNIVHNYREALRDVYPVVERLVGEDFFRFAADHYIPCHPSCQGNLHGFGGEFAAFSSNFPRRPACPTSATWRAWSGTGMNRFMRPTAARWRSTG